MDLEGRVTELNKHFFFEEFTYSNNKFMPTPRKEVELADNIIWIGKSLIVFQLKERNAGDKTTEENEAKRIHFIIRRYVRKSRKNNGY